MSGSAMYTEVIDTYTAEPIGQFVWHMTCLLRGESATGGSAFCHLGVVSNHSPCRSRQELSMDQPHGASDGMGGRSETAGSDVDGALGSECLRCSPNQDISS